MKTISTIGLAVLCALPMALVHANTISTSNPIIDETNGCDLEATLAVTNDCVAGGSIVSTLTGGTAPFAYLWSNGATVESLLNVGSGTYTLTVVDANGCSDTVSADIDLSDGLAHNAVTTIATCGVNGGSVQTFVTGGTAPYTYEWSNGETDSDIAGLEPATYSVTITDANGCSLTDTFAVSSGSTIMIIQSLQADTCVAGVGSISISVSGGVPPYDYQWSTGDTGSSLTNLSAGTYLLTVTDSIGCVATAESNVQEIGNPICNINVVNADCDSAGGTAILLCAGGTAPYSFQWSNGETDDQADGLTMGTYIITITDAAGCVSIDTAEILQSGNPPVATYTTVEPGCGDENGSIDVSVSGGATPYVFLWSNGATSEDLDSVAAGVYTLTVTAANGCLAVLDVTINAAGACSAPSSTSSVVASGSVTISWSSVPCALKYRLRVKKLGAQGGPWMTYVVTDTSYALTGLVPGAVYKYRVRSQCSPDGSSLSPMTAGEYFTVPAGVAICEAPSGVSSSNVSMDGATILWSTVDGSYGYRLRYRVVGTSIWTPVVINNGTVDAYALTSLPEGTAYEYQVATKCESAPNVYSAFSATATFTTLTQRLGGTEMFDVATLYPNPAAKEVNIVLPFNTQNTIVNIYNAVGQIVLTQTVSANGNTLKLDVASLASGVYLVDIRDGEQHAHARLVKD